MAAVRGKLGEMELDRDPYAPAPPPGQDDLPFEDGEPMESERHRAQMHLLIDTLTDAWADRHDFYVGGNMFVYFSELQTKGEHFRGPDVFVVLDTVRKERKSWVVWEEGGRLPNVVIELLSPSTARSDREEKMRVYARVWRTAEYFLFDPFTQELEGFLLRPDSGEYQPIARDARGDLPVSQLGLSLGPRPGQIHHMSGPWLRWIGPGGAPLRTDRERADAAEQRVAELEAQLRVRR